MTSPKNGRKTFSQLSQLVHGRGNGWAIQITKPRSKETALDSGKSARGSINSLRQFKVQWVLISDKPLYGQTGTAVQVKQ